VEGRDAELLIDGEGGCADEFGSDRFADRFAGEAEAEPFGLGSEDGEAALQLALARVVLSAHRVTSRLGMVTRCHIARTHTASPSAL
jgi:hypothetical protein